MQIRNASPEIILQAMRNASEENYGGNLEFNRFEPKASGADVTLRVNRSSGPGHRLGVSLTSLGNQPRLVSACWHAHRDFMEELFKLASEARLRSAFATYNGKAEFEAKAPGTQYRNIGSQMRPMYLGDACDC